MNAIDTHLLRLLELGASDAYLVPDAPPTFRVEGKATVPDPTVLGADETAALAQSVLDERQQRELAEVRDVNLALMLPGRARFRCNVHRQHTGIGMVIRHVKEEVPSLASLGLPPQMAEVAMTLRGLALVVGATGCGKSTTLAAMIDHRNQHAPGHIVTVEDPIEFIHVRKQSIVTQREIGFDTPSLQHALRNALRQAPDVILIGEIRDTETMEAAIAFAETGHLCLATLHANNANQAIERILNFFPHERHEQIYLQLSLNLRSVVSQRLIPGVDGRRVAVVEVLMDTPRVKDLIKKGATDEIKEAMEQGTQEGCVTFDQALLGLHLAGKIDLDQALANADSPNNLRLRIRDETMKDGRPPDGEMPAFRIEGDRHAPRSNAVPKVAPEARRLKINP